MNDSEVVSKNTTESSLNRSRRRANSYLLDAVLDGARGERGGAALLSSGGSSSPSQAMAR